MTGLASLIQMRNHPIILTMVNNTLLFYTIWVIGILNNNNTNKPLKISQIQFDIIYLFSYEFNLAIIYKLPVLRTYVIVYYIGTYRYIACNNLPYPICVVWYSSTFS